MASHEIHHVSDTALWVAAYRAEESERPDALFQDPLARVLIGDRGQGIAEAMSSKDLMRWVMAIRTVAIDRLIQKAVEKGVDTVLNLGAGLDTRPYRMKLPPSLRWIEVDFPETIELKNLKLVSEKPVCRLERVALDLSKRPERVPFFEKIGAESKRVLVITEGVIPYLKPEEAAELATNLREVSNFVYWIQDFYQGVRPGVAYRWRTKLRAAPMQFNVKDWFEFFGAFGWKQDDVIYGIDLAHELRRWPVRPVFVRLYEKLTPKFLRRGPKARIRRMFGFVLLIATS